jgi:acyl carrier protein
MYKTGDLGRWLRDGNIEFVGRNDFQVKMRGYRMELGEIEARLAEQADVGEAVVVVREDEPGEKRLVAYYTTVERRRAEGEAGGGEEVVVGAEQLRRHLAGVLPEYMVPAAYVRMEKLPLTANGKLNRQGLPKPEGDAYAVRGYEAPQGEMETRLAGIWMEVLKVERVGRQDNFFALGGHSLLAVRVISRLREELQIEVGIRDLFAHAVLADLAGAVERARRAKLPPITRAQRNKQLPSVMPRLITATGPNGHRIASRDNGCTWYDLQTGKTIE